VREPFHRDGWIYEEKVDGVALSARSSLVLLGAFELPRRMTPKVKLVGPQSRGCVALIFDLEQHLVLRH
jgi:hypothetical protein